MIYIGRLYRAKRIFVAGFIYSPIFGLLEQVFNHAKSQGFTLGITQMCKYQMVTPNGRTK